MRFENTKVFNFESAIRGMRNPKESWDRSDSELVDDCDENNCNYKIGPKDLKLMQSLIRAGSEHRKFMRQIFVSVDITAPLYWWKEFDTYKVGTVANSTSTMHKIHSNPITIECFEHKNLDDFDDECSLVLTVKKYIEFLEVLRQQYLETKNYALWKALICWLPESWLQTRTVTMNYENLLVMCRQRERHKLSEWCNDFISWAKQLPYAYELIFFR